MANLNDNERLKLNEMINEMGSEDNTEQIRRVKHSVILRDEIRKLDTFRKANISLRDTDPAKFTSECQNISNFLYTKYTDLFNRILKDELDFEIMTKLLIILKLIEDGKVDQHEGSVMVGKVLKELYVDSALKAGENLDKKYESTDSGSTNDVPTNDIKQISWREYKSSVKLT
tara:strand:- start:2474 stop:2992 length:519 start_codon:yes stop_codon:yes gene_type:complete